MINRFILLLAVVILAAVPVHAHAGDGPDEEMSLEDLEKEMEEVASFSYAALGKRDPFEPPAAWLDRNVAADDSDSPDLDLSKPKREKELLESFQLDSLKLVAILFKIGKQQPAAMIRDPKGHGHLVRAGNYLGVNEGRITRITDGKIEIVEPLRGRVGGKSTRTIVLKLSDRNQENADSQTK